MPLSGGTRRSLPDASLMSALRGCEVASPGDAYPYQQCQWLCVGLCLLRRVRLNSAEMSIGWAAADPVEQAAAAAMGASNMLRVVAG